MKSGIDFVTHDIRVERVGDDDYKIELDLPEKFQNSRQEGIQQELDELGHYDSLSKDNKVLYDRLVKELKNLQEDCFHSYELISFIYRVRKICFKCGYEDEKYDHFKDS